MDAHRVEPSQALRRYAQDRHRHRVWLSHSLGVSQPIAFETTLWIRHLRLCPLGGHGTLCSFGGVLNPLWANRVCGVLRIQRGWSHQHSNGSSVLASNRCYRSIGFSLLKYHRVRPPHPRLLWAFTGCQPPRMFSLQSFVNRIGRSNRENGHLVSESTHRSCGLAPPSMLFRDVTHGGVC